MYTLVSVKVTIIWFALPCDGKWNYTIAIIIIAMDWVRLIQLQTSKQSLYSIEIH